MMEIKDIVKAGRRRYRRFHRLAAVATAICVAVITGSLMVGDSVRESLRLRALDRLFGMESVVISSGGYLGAEAMNELGLGDESRAVLLSDGFVSRSGRLLPVMVWGMDVLPDGSPLPKGSVAVNTELSRELGDLSDPYIVLRLPNEGLIPSSSLFVTGRYTASMRLQYLSSIDARHGGNLSLKNGQVIPYNVFVNRSELCGILGLGDKLNVILSESRASLDCGYLSPSTLGLSMEDGRITSDGVFLRSALVDKLTGLCEEPNRLFSYLVNSISVNGHDIAYSFATAMDSWDGKELDGAILSDYAARRLGAKVGDEVSVTYFVADALKNLSERAMTFRVSGIVPIRDLVADGALSADYPGLSDAESCTRWESDLPIDTGLITDEDERYWEQYKSTPKILLPYDVMRAEWSDKWGDATQIRTSSPPEILDSVNADDFSVSVIQPLDSALDNAVGGVDFGGLFLALGCFIIMAALLLMYSPLGEMYAGRRDEISLLKSLGFKNKSISGILAREVAPVAAAGALAGSLLALAYAGLVIFLLGNIWSGATHTDGFALHPRPAALAIGLAAGLLLAAAVVFLAVRRAVSGSEAPSVRMRSRKHRRAAPIFYTAALLISFACSFFSDSPVVLFVITGCIALAAGLAWTVDFIKSGDATGASKKSVMRQSLRHSLPEVMTGIITLALGVFVTFAVGLNRKDFSDKRALAGSTGGFDLWCDLTVPLQHDISTPEGRIPFSLAALGDDAAVMQLSMVDGDDASCLNLNKVTNPAILGFSPEDFLSSGFTVKDNVFSLKDDSSVIRRMSEGDAVYGLVDETVLMWGMMLSVGDTLHYSGPSGEPVDVIIAGTLPNTVFQGSILVPEDAVERHWDARGSRVLLVKSDNPDAAELLGTALNEYGIRAVPCTERMRMFNSVTDTYLTIFLMLGAIGLLVGIAAFVIGVRKRLSRARKDIALYKSLGFADGDISAMLAKENTILPVTAILLGFAAALISIIASFGAVSALTWAVCILTSALAIFLVIHFVRRMARETVKTTFENEDTVY